MPGSVSFHSDNQLFKFIYMLFLDYYLLIHCYHYDVILLNYNAFGIVFAFNLCLIYVTFLINKLTMKKLLIVLMVLLGGIFSAYALSAGSEENLVAGPFEDVVGAIKQGDVNSLSRYLDNNVEINISGKANSYSKAQAEIILKDFFSKNQVKSFELVHQGGESSRFGIGNLSTSGGNYRLSFFLQKKGGAMVLNELRFENK